jgi:hypothetical protein
MRAHCCAPGWITATGTAIATRAAATATLDTLVRHHAAMPSVLEFSGHVKQVQNCSIIIKTMKTVFLELNSS